MELTQITFLQMMETLQDTLSAMEDNMSLRLNKIEQRLDSLEKVVSSCFFFLYNLRKLFLKWTC